MTPMYLRRVRPGTVRASRSTVTGLWYAEKATPVIANGRWAMLSHTVEGFDTHAEALTKALSWIPKKETPC